MNSLPETHESSGNSGDSSSSATTKVGIRTKADGSDEAYLKQATPEELLAAKTARLLEDCRRWMQTYLVLSSEQAVILAVWTLHSWVIDAAHCTPYLHITAPEKGCGKSRALEVLSHVACKPCMTGGTTAAALVRTMDAERPTLLLDEIDTAFGGNKELAEDLRGILNNGFKRGGNYRKVEGKDHKLRVFHVFGAKAIAGIGKIPDTIASRSIVVEMRRKLPGENVKALRDRDATEAAAPLRARLEEWATRAIIARLEAARPALPDSLSDRQKDISEILAAIANIASGEWPTLVRASLEAIFGAIESEDASIGVTLLRDIRTVFAGSEKIASSELAEKLCEIDGQPWADWAHGKGLDANRLAKQLKKYSISSKQVRTSDGNKKGYEREQFEDAWLRYCPYVPKTGGLSETEATTRINTGDSSHSPSETFSQLSETEATGAPDVAPSKRNMAGEPKHANQHEQRVVASVAPVAPFEDKRKQVGLFTEETL